MAFNQTWDESKPQGTDFVSTVDDEIRKFKEAIRERLALEHKTTNMNDDTTALRHKAGECSVLYYGTKASFPASPPANAIAYATDERNLYYYDGSDWQPITQWLGGREHAGEIQLRIGRDNSQVISVVFELGDTTSEPHIKYVPSNNAGERWMAGEHGAAAAYLIGLLNKNIVVKTGYIDMPGTAEYYPSWTDFTTDLLLSDIGLSGWTTDEAYIIVSPRFGDMGGTDGDQRGWAIKCMAEEKTDKTGWTIYGTMVAGDVDRGNKYAPLDVNYLVIAMRIP